MRNYRNTNDTTIENAFARLSESYVKPVEDILKRLLYAGMMFALSAHDGEHKNHFRMGDSYGWALWRNGSLVASDVLAKSDNTKASVKSEIASMTPAVTEGWYGVIMAGMVPKYYFAYDYENDILNMTAAEVAENFQNYFKQL